jgi:hypothetical protein
MARPTVLADPRRPANNARFVYLDPAAHPGLTLLAYTAAAGTPTADSLRMLASWAATAQQAGGLPAPA